MSNFLALAVAMAMAASSAQLCENSILCSVSSKDSRDATQSNGATMLHSLGVRFHIYLWNYSVKDNIAALKLAKHWRPIILCFPRSYNEAKVTQIPSKWEEDQLYFLDINTH